MKEDQRSETLPGLVAVLMGGPGSEREVSLASGRAVAKALRAGGCEVAEVEVRGLDFELPPGVVLAYNLIHGTLGEDGQLQAELERRGIPYTGAGCSSSRVAFDKVSAKGKFLEAGVPTPSSEMVDAARGKRPAMSLPYVVKAPCEGSSVGVYIVKTEAEAQAAFADVTRYADLVLVEQYVSGRELTVGVLDGEALPVVEIVAPEGKYDMATKYPWLSGAQGSRYFCPADLEPEATRDVQQAGLSACQALGVETYARADVLLDGSGRPWVLEVNTIPGMTATSLLPMAAAAAGIDFPELCLRIGHLGLALGSRGPSTRAET